MQLVHISCEICIREAVNHAPMFHDIEAVSDSRRKAEILLDEQNGEAFLLELLDRAPNLLDNDRC